MLKVNPYLGLSIKLRYLALNSLDNGNHLSMSKHLGFIMFIKIYNDGNFNIQISWKMEI